MELKMNKDLKNKENPIIKGLYEFYYCENCFKEGLKSYFEDRLGSIFCDEKCYKESLKHRSIKQ